jgi:ornithine decarboxylase
MSCQTLLKAAAVADGDGPQTRQRLDHIAVENYQIEVNDRFDRDVSEDAAVGACIAATGGIRREQVRQPGSIVESYRVADADVLGPAGETEGL